MDIDDPSGNLTRILAVSLKINDDSLQQGSR